MNQEYKITSRVYKSLIIILIIQFGLNILMRFVPIPVCRIPGVNIFIDFPFLYIFLIILYLWPINLRLEKVNKLNPKDEESNSIIFLKSIGLFLGVVLVVVIIIMQLIFALVAPVIFDSCRFITIILLAAIFPFHVYSNLIQSRNYPLLMFTTLAIVPMILSLSLHSNLVKFQFFLMSFIGIVIIWSLYIVGSWSKLPLKFLRIVNYFHSLAEQKFTAIYRRNFLQLILLSGLANLLFLVHAYLIIPRVEAFGLFRPNFERVITLIKDNKITANLPCEYGYFSNSEKNNVMISRKNGDLVVKFPIFNIGFGDGLVAIVYRGNKLDCKHEKIENQCEGFTPLDDSWYLEVY